MLYANTLDSRWRGDTNERWCDDDDYQFQLELSTRWLRAEFRSCPNPIDSGEFVIVQTIIQIRIIWFAHNLLIATNELQAVLDTSPVSTPPPAPRVADNIV